jgi:flagellar biosynthesis/type III secretory pathway protein FliH
MSAILKSGSASLRDRVRPLAMTMPLCAPATDPERERLAAEVEALTAELASRDEAIACHPDEVERAFQAGNAEGREAGRIETEDRIAERLATIEGAADRAVARFADQLAAMEGLALLVAQTCLDRMLLASEERSRIVADLIHGQVAALGEGAAVRIQVSAQDFDTPDALAQLAASAAGRGLEILASEALDSGDCRIVLQLGTLDIGLGQQLGAFRAELESMFEAERGA